MDFITQVTHQLQKMTEKEKDSWILSQAKLTAEGRQADFLLSLTGSKKVMGMPSEQEIAGFCQKVESGEIYLEYMTRYCEFDRAGHYMDDWEVWYEDPFGAGEFLDRVFIGCHELLLLDDCQMAADILERVLNLKFSVEEGEESEDGPEEEFLSMEDADGEDLFSKKLADVAGDWLRAQARLLKGQPVKKTAGRLLEILEHPVCGKVKPRILLEEDVTQQIFRDMRDMLERGMDELKAQLKELNKKQDGHLGRRDYTNLKKTYQIQKTLDRKQEILSDINIKCLQRDSGTKGEGAQAAASASKLEISWKKIRELAKWLSYERYIDDQPEQEEIRDICEELLQSDQLTDESWKIRREVLNDIISNAYYYEYGCDDCMEKLSEKLCANKSERLELADMMERSGHYREKAARLYHQCGRDDKYVSYLEENLGKRSKEYAALITYYQENGIREEACRVARLGLEKCREDLTDCFICLLLNAKETDDQEQFQKLYASAKRRKHADILRINAAINPQNYPNHLQNTKSHLK